MVRFKQSGSTTLRGVSDSSIDSMLEEALLWLTELKGDKSDD